MQRRPELRQYNDKKKQLLLKTSPARQSIQSPWGKKTTTLQLISYLNKQTFLVIYIARWKILYTLQHTLSLRTNKSLTELMPALNNINWSILGLSEVHRLGENIEDRGYFILYCNGETPGLYRTGFIIKSKQSLLSTSSLMSRSVFCY